MSEQEKSFSRKELYSLVWSTPLSRLAKEYAISDNGLRKICKKYNIPLPVLGYWQKVQYGKQVPKAKLPKIANEEPIILRIRKEGEPDPSINTDLARKRHELQNDARLDFEVKDHMGKPDPLITAARKDLASKKSDRYSRYKGIVNSSRGVLSVSISPSNLPRALRFLNKLISLLKLRGHKVIVDHEGTYALIDGEKIFFHFREILKQVKSGWSYGGTELVASGKLSLRLGQSYSSSPYQDRANKPLEAQLLNILTRLELEAEDIKRRRIEAEIMRREYEEEQRIKRQQYKVKEDQFNQFMAMFSKSERWSKAEHLRGYLKAVEEKAAQSGNITEDLKAWLKWAHEKADWYDPLIEKEDEIFKDIDRNKLEFPKKYWW